MNPTKKHQIILDYSKFQRYISPSRFERYLTAMNEIPQGAHALYQLNLKACQAFYPSLNLFEIFLRNAIYHELTIHFDNTNWILSEETGFMNDDSLNRSNFYLKKCIEQAKRTIQKRGGEITSCKITAEQSFGFWTSLFDVHHYRLIGGCAIHCFSNKPSHINRNILSKKLNRIRVFRNRVYHNEPICFKENEISISEAKAIKLDIQELLMWIDPDLSSFINNFEDIDEAIETIQSL